MEELSMEEAKCSLVRELLSCQGHSHLRCPPTKHAACSTTEQLHDIEDEMASPRRSVSVGNLSIAAAKHNLDSLWTHIPPEIPPLMSLISQPVPSGLCLGTDLGQ